MKRLLLLIVAIVATTAAHAQMSDSEVVEYVKSAKKSGLEQTAIAAELAQKGVTKEQLMRIRNAAQETAAPNIDETADRVRSASQKPIAASEPEIEDMKSTITRSAIFGHDIFRNKNLTFEPSLNIATPENYVLGPGDEVIVDIWGDTEQTIRQRISPDGNVVVRGLGAVNLNGLTVGEADSKLKKNFARIYSSVGGSTFMKLSLGQIRSIQVNVMGEVENPGTYTVSSLSSLFHVLYLAGGVNEIGSLRAINVAGRGTVDVYEYLLKGRAGVNIGLKDGDVVVVPPYQNLVKVDGKVKRPMKFETMEGETLGTVLGYAGGFAGDGYRERLTVVRMNGEMGRVLNVEAAQYAGFAVMDGDEVRVGGMNDRFENRLEIKGAVFRPGIYSLDAAKSVKELVELAGGLKGDAFALRAIVTRERADYSLEVISIDLTKIMEGSAADVALQGEDVVYVPSKFDLREAYTVTVGGAVRMPGVLDFVENASIEDVIIGAGGLSENASTARVDVYRRIRKPDGTSESMERSQSFSFELKDGMVAGDKNFVLQPFDMVEVRTSPGYESQKMVEIRGEVLFPGRYAITGKGERLSDLVKRAGGMLSEAYVSGTSLTRRMSEDERRRAESMSRLANRSAGRDSLNFESIDVYSVGIDMERALRNPRGVDDVALQEGDEIHVPEYVGTVAIRGAVLFPNTVAYSSGMSVSDYVAQAGGYASRARRGGKFIVHLNGKVSRARFFGGHIEPGSVIVVPYKKNNPNKMSAAEIISLGLGATSTAAMVGSLLK